MIIVYSHYFIRGCKVVTFQFYHSFFIISWITLIK